MYEKLRDEVYLANMKLVEYGLVILTWGNVSGIDRGNGIVAIKPSGVSYRELTPDKISVVDMDGRLIDGLRPSSDTQTHLEIYKAFSHVGGVVHTHSPSATAWAQSGMDLPPLGTTHADAFYGSVPCTPSLTCEEVQTDYEKNTGKVIVRTLEGKDSAAIPAVLVSGHGPFTWGRTPGAAVENSYILEEVARMALLTFAVNPSARPVESFLLEKHYCRKHGLNATYGQK